MSDLVSEDHILARIASHFPNEGPDVLLGRGDDCAVLGVSGPLCVSTDLFMEDVHFRRSYFTPEDIGWKALAVNLSDLTADGARPMGSRWACPCRPMRIWPLWTACARAWPSWRPKLPYRLSAATSPAPTSSTSA